MTYVITQACADSKDTACWDACPVDAIHPNPNRSDFTAYDQMYIDPAECIDCGACEPACPVEAIFADTEVPAECEDSIAANRDFFASPSP
jgi:NAD-dependent dihydropyrimidine dehydrogenase PreA subunit